MELHFYNTLTRAKERFVPLDPACVRLYVCGPTVYDYAHIGNARTFAVFDLLARLLKARYPGAVAYARNITDVDDKIIERSRQTGEPIESVTRRTAAQFHADMDDLGLLRPDMEPRATLYIPQMIAMIERLMAGGFAYEAQGHALFHVPSMADYGALSRRSQEDLIAGARVDVAPYKRNPADFVLWKPAKEGEPGWPSPWGVGRPGWHIECSAMTAAHFGAVFDIHGGGLDLIFPHHENEIAQSRCAHGAGLMAKTWMHAGFLTIGGDKMSKSQGNFYTVRELLDEFPADALRLAILTAHYRQPLDFTKEKAIEAHRKLGRWYQALEMQLDDGRATTVTEGMAEGVMAALADDLNTPQALAEIDRLASAVFAPDATLKEQAAAQGALRATLDGLGFCRLSHDDWRRWQPPAATEGGGMMTDTAIEEALARRRAARAAKDFAEADRIRQSLADQGILLKDGPQGTVWERAIG
jgi:cysteinyl-tRNA synthetase